MMGVVLVIGINGVLAMQYGISKCLYFLIFNRPGRETSRLESKKARTQVKNIYKAH